MALARNFRVHMCTHFVPRTPSACTTVIVYYSGSVWSDHGEMTISHNTNSQWSWEQRRRGGCGAMGGGSRRGRSAEGIGHRER
eukprot:5907828-Pleurochrysis_carterae.AAC.1